MDKEFVVINTKKRWLLSFVSMFVGPFELKPGWIIKIDMGEVLLEIVIHTAIVYYGVTHKSGLMVSSVDGVAKIWKEGVCVQSVEHPRYSDCMLQWNCICMEFEGTKVG